MPLQNQLLWCVGCCFAMETVECLSLLSNRDFFFFLNLLVLIIDIPKSLRVSLHCIVEAFFFSILHMVHEVCLPKNEYIWENHLWNMILFVCVSKRHYKTGINFFKKKRET